MSIRGCGEFFTSRREEVRAIPASISSRRDSITFLPPVNISRREDIMTILVSDRFFRSRSSVAARLARCVATTS